MPLQTKAAEQVGSKRRVWVSALIIVAVLAVIGLLTLRTRPVAIRFATVTRQNISSSIATNGKVEPVQNFEAHAPLQTSVKKMVVTEGQHVSAGQPLLQLDDTQVRSDEARAEAQVKAAQAELDAVRSGGTHEEVFTTKNQLTGAQTELRAAQKNLDTMKRLEQSGAASPAEVQDAEGRLKNAQSQVNLLQQKSGGGRFSSADVQRAEAQLEQAKAAYAASRDMLSKLDIRAPFAGEAYYMPLKVGNFVNPGDLLAEVADLSHVVVKAYVDEPDIGKLALGQSVTVTWDALPGRSWQGKVTQIPTTVITRGARSVGEVTCEIDNGDRKLLPNVNVSVLIVTAKHENVLTVPREAIHQEDGKRYVLEVVNDKLVRRDVQASIANLTDIEITSGLTDGAKIALGAYNNQPLHDGVKVTLPK
jgi:HlyD family secretion protein